MEKDVNSVQVLLCLCKIQPSKASHKADKYQSKETLNPLQFSPFLIREKHPPDACKRCFRFKSPLRCDRGPGDDSMTTITKRICTYCKSTDPNPIPGTLANLPGVYRHSLSSLAAPTTIYKHSLSHFGVTQARGQEDRRTHLVSVIKTRRQLIDSNGF